MKSNVLLVSSLPPSKCGVAKYAQEHLDVMREEGLEVTTASPETDSSADIHFGTLTLRGAFAWLAFCATHRFETVHVHYVDRFFFPMGNYGAMGRILLRSLQSLALRLLACKSSTSFIVIHELATRPNLGRTFFRWRDFGLSKFTEVQFHTPSMKEEFLAVCTSVSGERCTLVAHERFMRRKYCGTKESAREQLLLPPKRCIFICLGFIQESKGFDEVVAVFGKSGLGTGVELHVVGSVQANDPASARYAADLEKACQNTPNCHFHGEFLSDEKFDCWLAAADLLFLPYRGIVSSSVGARAELYGCPIVTRSLANLSDQFPMARRFTDAGELLQIMESHALPDP